MTYLQLINAVLRRLRQDEVTDVNENDYSKLIGEYVNSVKKECETAWNWNALAATLILNTSPNVFSYSLDGSGTRFRVLDVGNDTSDFELQQRSVSWMNKYYLGPVTPGIPNFYSFNGVNINGDSMVDVYPIPDNVYTLRFNVIIPQEDLVANNDTLLIPSEPVIQGALARAISERGEDGGRLSNDQYILYRSALADESAVEAGRFPEDTVWYTV